MKNELLDYEKFYTEYWINAFQNGREDFGDLDLAVIFLDKTDLLKKEHFILEVGCGVGKLCNFLYNHGYRNIIGTDISHSAINYGKNKFPRLQLQQMDANSLKFNDNYFDACLSFDVLEHLPDIRKHLKEINRILKPGGHYLFQTPNILSNGIIETIRYKGFGWKKYHPSLQFSWSLKNKLVKEGFDEIKFIKIIPLSDYKLKILPGFIKYIVKFIPWSRIPIFLQTGFYVIASKNKQDKVY
ncbi:MAG: class I SAM-dependent methyltransferase [Candidatus Moranbacteria bacterium]|nr:class I SAM-dependent methyltransferase [Candidatus Moranbacteria bacterium]